MEKKLKVNLGQPDEVRTFPRGKMDIVRLGDRSVARTTLEPGYKWSECLKESAGTESCTAHHSGIVLSGRVHIAFDDGTHLELGPGDVYDYAIGHDAWVVGNDPCVAIDVAAAATWAKPREKALAGRKR